MEEQPKKKKKIFLKILIFLLMMVALIYCYMHFIEPSIIISEEYIITDELIPNAFHGFKIGHFSDIHFGRTTNENEIKKMVTELNLMKADVIFFTGDLFDEYITLSDKNIEFLSEQLQSIDAKLGKYAIKGDSDYLNEEAFEKIMKDANFQILDNQNTMLYYLEKTPIYIGGISSITKEKNNLEKALQKDNPGYQILLAHEPIIIEEAKNEANLIFAGHSLGGLIHIPFFKEIMVKENVKDYCQGKYTLEDTTMYVSSGIGTENISLRFLNYPKVTLYRIHQHS